MLKPDLNMNQKSEAMKNDAWDLMMSLTKLAYYEQTGEELIVGEDVEQEEMEEINNK